MQTVKWELLSENRKRGSNYACHTYTFKGKFELVEQPKPQVLHERDAIVKMTLTSICSSGLQIKHGSGQTQRRHHGRRTLRYPQTLTLLDLYGKNLTFKTGGVDGCDCAEILALIEQGKLNTEPLITHTYPLAKIDESYDLFANKRDGVIKVAVDC